MSRLCEVWLLCAAVVGGLAVVLGAFGAHGVPSYLQQQGYDSAAVAIRLANFETAARYQTYAALFLLGLALAIDRKPLQIWNIAGWAMLAGALLFSGILYTVALVPDELRGTFARFAPIGGGLMIAGWLALGIGALRTAPARGTKKTAPAKK